MAPVAAPGAPANPDPPARVAPAALLVGHANSSEGLLQPLLTGYRSAAGSKLRHGLCHALRECRRAPLH